MTSFIFLVILLVVGLYHGRRIQKRTGAPIANTMLAYVVAGYCGAYMMLAGVMDLSASFRGETIFPFPNSSGAQQFFDFALLGMAIMAIASAWFRGRFLVVPVAGWSVFWIGATYIHFTTLSAAGNLTVWTASEIFFSHTVVAIVMGTLLVFSDQELFAKKWSDSTTTTHTFK